MPRSPVSLYKRPAGKKSRSIYYIRLWIEKEHRYAVARSASIVAEELGIDPKLWPPTTKAGALHIAEKLREAGPLFSKKDDLLLADYCAEFWDWEKSDYIRGKLDRGQKIGRTYCGNMNGYVLRHVKPRVPRLRLLEVTAQDLDHLQLRIKREAGLGARSINAIMDAVCMPIREAFRLGKIKTNPAIGFRSLSDDTRAKGILSTAEMEKLLSEPWEDERNRLAVEVGYSTGARLGEVLALRIDDVALDFQGKPVLWIRASWSVTEGRKSTKTGNVRVVPIDEGLRDDLLSLGKRNPHGNGLLFWDDAEKAEPFSSKRIEGGFYRQLRKIGLDSDERKTRNVTFHSLRHAFNSALRGAIPDATLQLATGHTTAQMTEHYDHLTDERLSAIREAQEARIVLFKKKAAGK